MPCFLPESGATLIGDVLVLTSKPCGGLMAGVLSESPPTPEVRDFAKAVLKASGVRLIRAATSAGRTPARTPIRPNERPALRLGQVSRQTSKEQL